MSRLVIIDETIIKQINYGNADVAKAMRDLVRGRAEIWMTRAAYGALHLDAEQRLISELDINYPIQDRSIEKYERRVADVRGTGGGRQVRPEETAALALDKGGELLTANSKLANAYRNIGSVAPESFGFTALPEVMPSDINYNVGRRLLGLRDLNITALGKIVPGAKPAPAATSSGPRTKGGALTTKTITQQVGDPLEAPEEHGLSATGDAKFQGGTVALQVANFALQKINDMIQKRRFDEKMARVMPGVESTLKANPHLGVLFLVYYSRGSKPEASAIDPVLVFQDLRVAYGLTEWDARRKFDSADQIAIQGQGEQVGRTLWFPPREPVSISQLPTPFPKAGLATFVPGKEKVTRVKFSMAFGFDDKARSREWLNVTKDVRPRFLYLTPPDEIT